MMRINGHEHLFNVVKCTVRNWYVEQYVAVVHQFHQQQQQQPAART